MLNVSQPLDLRSMVSERDGYIIVESKLPKPEQNGNKKWNESKLESLTVSNWIVKSHGLVWQIQFRLAIRSPLDRNLPALASLIELSCMIKAMKNLLYMHCQHLKMCAKTQA